MTVGRHEYSDAEIMRMQRDAEARVREMQSRARQTVEQNPIGPPLNRQNRNWSTNPNMQRRNRPQYRQQQPPPPPRREAEQPRNDPKPDPPPPAPPCEETKKPTTIVEDIMSALGLDEDYILIIGLLLILINQRADTTLILALAYLLI